MSELGIVKTLHGTGNITKGLEKITPCRTTYENSEISHFHGNEPVQNDAISVVITLKVIMYIVSNLGSLMWSICDRLQEKGPCGAKNIFTVNAGFRKYDAIATSIENLTFIGRVVCEI